jgi:cytochrome c5
MLDTGTLGVLFLVVGLVAMFLMYHLWGYPFDKVTRTSAAPRWAMRTHRALGYLFALIYIALMWRMVPRLWEYQVEFPARTTVHIVLGFAIGFLLLIKIAIARFFRHFEEWMPYLGTSIMLGTVILLGLSLPYALQERALASAAFSDASRARVEQLLPKAGLPSDAPLAELATAKALSAGRTVLLESCVKCHDLKTILAKPRTPSGWWNTVERMAEKPALFRPMSEREMYDVTAYLIAITPDLQKASKQRHRKEVAQEDAMTEAMPAEVPTVTPVGVAVPPQPNVVAPVEDLAVAKKTYEEVCSQCHDLSDVDKAPPKTTSESREMIQRMIKENDAELTAEQITLVAAWLDAHYVAKNH